MEGQGYGDIDGECNEGRKEISERRWRP